MVVPCGARRTAVTTAYLLVCALARADLGPRCHGDGSGVRGCYRPRHHQLALRAVRRSRQDCRQCQQGAQADLPKPRYQSPHRVCLLARVSDDPHAPPARPLHPGWLEHDPLEIWNAVQECVARTLADQGLRPEQLTAVGITNQRETTVVWDRTTGKPFYNASASLLAARGSCHPTCGCDD